MRPRLSRLVKGRPTASLLPRYMEPLDTLAVAMELEVGICQLQIPAERRLLRYKLILRDDRFSALRKKGKPQFRAPTMATVQLLKTKAMRRETGATVYYLEQDDAFAFFRVAAVRGGGTRAPGGMIHIMPAGYRCA